MVEEKEKKGKVIDIDCGKAGCEEKGRGSPLEDTSKVISCNKMDIHKKMSRTLQMSVKQATVKMQISPPPPPRNVF
jgi:hypothetical protein